MEALNDIGMLERFLERPHNKVDSAQIRIAGREYVIGDLSHLDSPAPFIALMPQWDFLDFLRDEAQSFPGFMLEMEAEVVDLVERDRRIEGVRLANGQLLTARKLVLMADGRGSLVRKKALMPIRRLGAPMDVLWFTLPKQANPGDKLRGSVDTGRMAILIDRDTYWQAAFLVSKGHAEEIKAKGAKWIMDEMKAAFPDLSFEGEGAPKDASDLFTLNVALDRLECWHRPGMLAIGDAAHAMSPIGGIGINLAIQDAVATANILTADLLAGREVDARLAEVQARRMFPTRVIQRGQKLAQDKIIGAVLGGTPITTAPLAIRVLDRFPLLRRLPGRIIGQGIRRERVNSPAAH